MKKIFLNLFSLILFFIILDVFLPIDIYAFRHWEKFYKSDLIPGPFIPNKFVEGYEYKDRYLSNNKEQRQEARNKQYTKWITDELGFRNNNVKSNLYNSDVIFVGDSNFVGSSFDQHEIVSELYMSQTNYKAYTIAYNLRYLLTFIESSSNHNIKHVVLEGRPNTFNGIYSELLPFYIDSQCRLNLIYYPNIIDESTYDTYEFYKYKYKNRPFSKYIRSKLGIYNFPLHSDKKKAIPVHKNNDKKSCVKPSNNVVKKDYSFDEYYKNKINLISDVEKNLFFKKIMLYLEKYFKHKDIKFTMLLLTDHNTDDEFKVAVKELNSNGKFIYDSNDLMMNGDIWQVGDSHWKVEAARNFINILKNQ